MQLATTDQANKFLVEDPFALLAGMLLDQHVYTHRINGLRWAR